jgi:hypothetical protein
MIPLPNHGGGGGMGDCPLVIIRWQDSRQPCGHWRFLSALPETSAVEVATVGWLVKNTADVMVVCQNVGDLAHPEKAQASGIMTVERLTEADGSISSEIAGSAAIADDREIATAPMRRAL